jgi:hypothetical protein
MHDDEKKDFLVAKEAASMVMDIKKKNSSYNNLLLHFLQ